MQVNWHNPANAREAITIQEVLRHRVSLENAVHNPQCIAGVDCSYDLKTDTARAVVVLMQMGEWEPRHIATAEIPTPFPYIPGLLSFREIPVILKALEQLPQTPDVLMVDGQGIAHPRRLGIAAHLGVVTDSPAIGVAKSRLTGTFTEPGLNKGDAEPLMHHGERIGTVLRSRDKVRPLFISPGHKIDISTATQLVINCLTRYRIPEPTRIADKFSKKAHWNTLPHPVSF